jgi:hypothetical protein
LLFPRSSPSSGSLSPSSSYYLLWLQTRPPNRCSHDEIRSCLSVNDDSMLGDTGNSCSKIGEIEEARRRWYRKGNVERKN